MNPFYRYAVVVVFVALFIAIAFSASRRISANSDAGVESTESVADNPQKSIVAGFDFSNIDKSANACQDFNQFANGGWMAKNAIPAAYSVWGRFTQLDEQNTMVLHDILDGLLKKKTLAGNKQKIADFYGSCMDEKTIEAEGIKPLEPELQRIDQVNDLLSLEDEIARFHAHRVPAVFGFGATQDFKDSTAIIAQAVQGGLGLPDRDYYLSDDAKSKQTRDEYQKHVARTFELMGDAPDRAAAEAATVMKIETKLAENSLTRVQRRNPEANYHPMTKAQLIEMT
ncbi:MAG TPA: M13 family metallopeptidase N-terminal domain-containing protein, partial [Pyrinomonadaceae bacterium]